MQESAREKQVREMGFEDYDQYVATQVSEASKASKASGLSGLRSVRCYTKCAEREREGEREMRERVR